MAALLKFNVRRAVRTSCVAGLLAWAGVAWAAPLVLAIGDTPLFAALLVAEADGLFAAEGLDVKVIHCINGRRCLKHLTDGEADVATVADIPIMFAMHAGHRFDIIATYGITQKENMLVARGDHGIRTAADLAGKRIGVLRGTTVHYYTSTLLLLAGIPRDSVSLVPLDAENVLAPLLAGEVDAAALYKPYGPQAMQQLGRNAVALKPLRAYIVTGNLVAKPELPQATLVAVLRATAKACALFSSSPARVQALLAARWKLDAGSVAAQLEGYDFQLSLEQSLLSTLEAESRWAVREGLVGAASPPDFLARFRVEPLRAINPQLVTLVK